MMEKMTEYQRRLTEDNMDLVNKVIQMKINIPDAVLMSYEDFYQVGCEALCRAAMAYDPVKGTFAPFACTFIYHALIDHCRRQNTYRQKQSGAELNYSDDPIALAYVSCTPDVDGVINEKELRAKLDAFKEIYTGVAKRGVEAMSLKSLGYSSREIADRYHTTVNNVNAWISRARAKLGKEAGFTEWNE